LRLAGISMRHNKGSQRHVCNSHNSEVRKRDLNEAGGLIGIADGAFGADDVREKVRGEQQCGKTPRVPHGLGYELLGRQIPAPM